MEVPLLTRMLISGGLDLQQLEVELWFPVRLRLGRGSESTKS